jgi:hypothetical protein
LTTETGGARTPGETATAGRGERVHYLDTLKVAIVYGIFLYHAALPFTWTSWLVSSPRKSLLLTGFVLFCFPWGIPMMFLLAGADSWFALRRRSAAAFLRARFLRLVLPLAAGIALLSPLQAYLTGTHATASAADLPHSYPAFFRGIRLSWTPEWLGRYGYHLWFLGYLFAISAALLPVLELLRRPAGRRAIAAAADLCRRPGAIFALALPLVASQVALRSRYPAYQDWADIATYALVFLAGSVLAAERRFEESILRALRPALALGTVSSVAVGLFLLLAPGHLPPDGRTPPAAHLAYGALWALMIWSWMLAVLNLGIRRLNFGSRATAYLADSILPFYILHHPVVVVVTSAVVGLPLGAWPEFLLVVAVSLSVTLAVYELGVRRWRPTRFLFGLKPLPAPGPRLRELPREA